MSKKRMINSLCVYCGSRFGERSSYKTAAAELGQWIARTERTLVYGAGSIGLMGVVAQATIKAGGDVIGIIPGHLDHIEITQKDMTETIITATMHERKQIMFDRSDAFVVLPGGLGSMDEFFEMLTWSQLRLHCKPIFLYNVDGYWTPLLSLIDHMINEGFADPTHKDLFTVVDTQDQLTELLEAGYSEQHPAKDKFF